MDFTDQEKLDGLRFSWNVWPRSRLDVVRNIVPLGCLLTPVKDLDALYVLPNGPVRCKCQAVLNPYCSTDFVTRMWICPMCNQRNAFPRQYHGVNTSNIPAELFEQCTSIEYTLDKPAVTPPAFLLIIDLCLDELEVEGLKTALRQLILLLPPYCLVGIITFGCQVFIHQLGHDIPIATCFQPSASFSKDELGRMLRMGHTKGLKQQQQQPGQAPPRATADFEGYLARSENCEAELEAIIEGLQAEQEGRAKDERPVRATGTAVALAVSMLELLLPAGGAHLLLFTSGPATVGQGTIVGQHRTEAIRSHRDFETGALKHFQQALTHYDRLADRMNKCGHTMDVFACSLDQVGLAEMHPAVHYTGGCMMMAESYGDKTVAECIAKYFQLQEDQALQFRTNAKLTLFCSPEVKIQGASGPCCSLGEGGPSISETVKMAGNTNAWRLSCLTPSTTICLFLDIAPRSGKGSQEEKLLHMQFQTEYLHPSGQRRLRVVTTARQWAEDSDSNQIPYGFDQEAAMSLMVRWMNFKLMGEEAADVAAWLDKSLIALAARFGQYSAGQPDSLQLPIGFSMLPQWFYNVRRSPLMQVFGISPDETAYMRHLVDRESVTNCLTMIQPQLIAFSLSQPPRPVLLDVKSIVPDEILVLDTFLVVLVHYGATVAEWVKAGYADMPEHASFRDFLASAREEAERLLQHRYPVPKLLEVNQGGSQARFLLARLNPSQTHEERAPASIRTGEIIVTEDIPFGEFYKYFSEAVVESP